MTRESVKQPGMLVGVGLILATLAGWTAVPVMVKDFVDDVDPWTSNGWRYGFAAVLWMPYLIYRLASKRVPAKIWAAGLIPGLANAAGQVAFTTAFYFVGAGLMTFGLRFQIVAVTIGAAIMFPVERRVIRSPVFVLGMAMLLCGVLATAGLGFMSTTGAAADEAAAADAGSLSPSTRVAIGVGLSMFAGAAFGVYALAVRRFMKPYGAMESFAVISQYTAACMVVLMLLFGAGGGTVPLSLAAGSTGWMAYFLGSAVIGIAAGHVLYYFSIQRLGVTVSAGVLQLQPFTVGALSAVVFGEILSIGQWLTGIVAVGGAIAMIVAQHLVYRRMKAETIDEQAEGVRTPDAAHLADLEDEAGVISPRPGA